MPATCKQEKKRPERKQRKARVASTAIYGPLSHYTARRWEEHQREVFPSVLAAEAVLWAVPHPETGLPLAELVLGSRGPSLRMYDHEGVMRVQLCACPQQGAAVEVCGDKAEAVAALWDFGKEGGAALAFAPEGETKAVLAAGAAGDSGRLDLFRVVTPSTEPGLLGERTGASLTVSADDLIQAEPLKKGRG